MKNLTIVFLFFISIKLFGNDLCDIAANAPQWACTDDVCTARYIRTRRSTLYLVLTRESIAVEERYMVFGSGMKSSRTPYYHHQCFSEIFNNIIYQKILNSLNK